MDAGVEEIPEQGELVLTTVQNITPHGVYVTLDEYGGLRGFLHVSEISTGWVRNIERFVKLNQKSVLKVIRINKARREVDLSLRQVTGEEKKQKLIEVKNDEKARSIIELVKSRLNLTSEVSEQHKNNILSKFDTLYDAMEEMVEKGGKSLQKLNLPEDYVAMLESVAKEKIIIPMVVVKGVMDLTSSLPDGIEVIKSGLSAAESLKIADASIKVSYIGSPKYRIVVTAKNYKIAEKALETAIQEIKDAVEERKGTFVFTRLESRRKAGG